MKQFSDVFRYNHMKYILLNTQSHKKVSYTIDSFFSFQEQFLCEIQLKPLLLIFKTWRNRDSNTQFSSVTVVIWCLRIYQTQGIQSLCFYVKNNVFWLNVMGERLFLLLEYIIQESIIIEKTYNSFAFKTWVIRPFLNLNIE